MQDLKVDSLKINGRHNSQEGITKQVLTSCSGDAKESLHPKFKRCKDTSVEWYGWCIYDLQLHSLEGVLFQDMIRL